MSLLDSLRLLFIKTKQIPSRRFSSVLRRFVITHDAHEKDNILNTNGEEHLLQLANAFFEDKYSINSHDSSVPSKIQLFTFPVFCIFYMINGITHLFEYGIFTDKGGSYYFISMPTIYLFISELACSIIQLNEVIQLKPIYLKLKEIPNTLKKISLTKHKFKKFNIITEDSPQRDIVSYISEHSLEKDITILKQSKFIKIKEVEPKKTSTPIIDIVDYANLQRFIFTNLDALQITVELLSNKLKKHTVFKDKKERIRIVCREQGCKFLLTFVNCQDGKFMNVYQPHTCQNNPNFISKYSRITRHFLNSISPSSNSFQFNQKYKTKISRITFTRTFKLTGQTFENLKKLILKIVNEGGLINMPIYATQFNRLTFHYIYWMPKHIKQYLSSNLFLGNIVADGTFLSISIRGNLILFITISPNNTYIPVGVGWAPTENSIYISKMMLNLRNCVANEPDFIIDQGKALTASIRDVFISKIRYCMKHLQRSKYGKKIFALKSAKTKEEFDRILDKILDKVPEKDKHLICEKFRSTSRFYNPIRALNHTTNNAAESINALIKKQNFKTLSDFFEFLYDFSLKQITSLGSYLQENDSNYVDFVFMKFKKYDDLITKGYISCTNTVHEKPDYYIFTVKDGRREFKVEVNNDNFHCECKKDTEYMFPCKHILSIIRAHPQFYTLDNFINPCFKKDQINQFVEHLHDVNQEHKETYIDIEDFNKVIEPLSYIATKEKRLKAFD